MPYDPVTLDVIWSRLISICDEAETGVVRTTFSSRIREGRDFCCVLLNDKGELIAQGSLSHISFVTTAPYAAQEILKKFPPEALNPGDVLITNNPWVQGGHLYDNFVIEPVFHRGRLVALVGSIAHWSDIGGRGERPDNRSIYEEGLQLSIIKIAKRGQFNEEVLEIIRENVRFPEEVMSEFKSQLLGISLIGSKLIEVVEKQRIEDFRGLGDTILARSEAAMRDAIAQIPDGDYENEIPVEGIDRELTVKVKISVRGTDIHVDFAGSSPQTEWAINSMPSFTHAYAFIGIKAAVAPYLPNNSGQMRPVSVSMPLGSIVNPRPRSVGAAARNIVAHFCCLGVLAALAKAVPQRAQAASCPQWPIIFSGVTDGGTPFHSVWSGTGGLGARHDGDGSSCIHFPSSVRNLPIESIENRWPMLLVERRQIQPDSGGPGRCRGGLGQHTDVRVVSKVSATCCTHVRGITNPAQGLLGGGQGAAGSFLLNGTPVQGLIPFMVNEGDQVSVITAGGGGFGDPLDRDPARVLEDVVTELVFPEQARATYGVVIDAATKTVDLEATATLRHRLLAEADTSCP